MVAVVGRANVGKSTLVNRLLGEKVSIVSPVAQTTRNLVRGILTEPRGQVVFLDTPGMHKATHDLGRIMNRTARMSIEGADAVMLVLDAAHPPRDEDRGWMGKLAAHTAPVFLVFNKIDRGTAAIPAHLAEWQQAAAAAAGTPVEPVRAEVSAAAGTGVDALLDALFARIPPGPPLFPDDILTDFPRKWTIADVVREKLFMRLDDELPHAVAARVERIDEASDRWTVDVTILVNRPSQKAIVIGGKGRNLRAIRRIAEPELSAMYGHPVTLNLWVKVEKDWAKNHWILKQLGYVT